MANLQKIIKVTQQQYDTLASGGTVGDYTGLNANYIYLVVDESPDLPNITASDYNKYLHTNSSTGNLEWSSINIDLDETINLVNDGDTSGTFTQEQADRIRANHNILLRYAGSYYRMIYDEGDDNSFTFNNISDYGDGIALSAVEVDLSNNSWEVLFNIIDSIVEDVRINNTSIVNNGIANITNMMTTDTAQTISVAKTFSNGLQVNTLKDLNGNNKIGLGTNVAIYGSNLISGSNGSYDLGTAGYYWRDLHLSRNLTDGTNSITVAEIVAKQDAVEVKRYI